VNNKDIRIIHKPFGNEQPYYQQPFERLPRMPRLDEPVSIGMVVDPMSAAETVQLYWSIDGTSAAGCQDGICLGNSDSVGNSGCERYWLASLPPMTESGTMRYHFVIQTGDQVIHSEEYTYRVGPRVIPNKLQAMEDLGPKGVLCTLGDALGGQILLQISSTVNGVQLGYGTASSAMQTSSQGETGVAWKIQKLEKTVELSNAYAMVRLNTEDLTLEIFDTNGISRISTSCAPYVHETFTSDGRGILSLRQAFHAPHNEKYIGFGERYTPLDQRGNILSNRVFEQYKNQRLKTYLPMPFFFTNHDWGFLSETNRLIEFDMAARDPYTWVMEAQMVAQEALVLQFIMGNPQSIYQNFISTFKKPELPPDWVFGPWMSSNEWNSQKRVEEVLGTTKELDIPATVLVIEAWSDETTFYIWNDAQYTPKDASQAPKMADFTYPPEGLWPNPHGMIQKMDAQGVHLVLWQIPIIKEIGQQEHVQHRLNEEHVQDHNLILRNPDGSPYQVLPGWFKKSMVIDFDNPQAREWWFSRRRYLLEEMGVSGFKTDGGEHLWGYGITAGNGTKGDELINTYPQSYINAYTEELRQTLGKNKGILFSRSGYRGAQSTPAHWTGDQDSTWNTFRSVIYAMIHSSIAGIPFMGWDIGGFTGDFPTSELYLRSAATAAFSPIMQYHSEFNHHRTPNADRTPWNVQQRTGDTRVVPVYRMFAKLRMAMVDYLKEEAQYAIDHAQPFVRPLFFIAPEDPIVWTISDEYLLGRYLLVAPVIEEGAVSRTVYLPKGSWTYLWTGKTITGGQSISIDSEVDTIALFRKEDTDFPKSLPGPQLFQTLLNSIK
jgi:alpha-D-xyloside xylohydrolase